MVTHLDGEIADAGTNVLTVDPQLPQQPTIPNNHQVNNIATPPPPKINAPPPVRPVVNPYFPWIQIQPAPAYFIPPTFCCSRYMQWLSRRKGRPPHDLNCINHGNKTVAGAIVAFGEGARRAGMGEI